MKTTKKTKILLTIAICFVVIAAGALIAWAVSVSDSFTTTDNVGDTWNINVDTTAGEVKLVARTCDSDTWFCDLSTTCANTLGDGDYIIVKKIDVTGTKVWKTANTDCDQPQCGQTGGQDGDNLVADNTINFSGYTARSVCQAAGGRLPTKAELNCIYTNKASFGDNFQASYYWSATESSVTHAWTQSFDTGAQIYTNKSYFHYVRCVFGW